MKIIIITMMALLAGCATSSHRQNTFLNNLCPIPTNDYDYLKVQESAIKDVFSKTNGFKKINTGSVSSLYKSDISESDSIVTYAKNNDRILFASIQIPAAPAYTTMDKYLSSRVLLIKFLQVVDSYNTWNESERTIDLIVSALKSPYNSNRIHAGNNSVMANRSIDQKSITFTVLSKSTDSNCSKVRSINNLNLWTRDIEKNHCFKNLLPLERNDWLSRPSYAQKFLKDRYYLANNENKPVEYLNSGILYTELRKGCGSKPTVNSRVKVRYHGTLTSGKVFDSSYLRGKPDIFNLETVIEGLRKSISNMKEGSIWEIYIPYQEGFGHRNPGPIPPYSNLIFTIELISIE